MLLRMALVGEGAGACLIRCGCLFLTRHRREDLDYYLEPSLPGPSTLSCSRLRLRCARQASEETGDPILADVVRRGSVS